MKQLMQYTDSPSLSCPLGTPLASCTAAGGAGGGPAFFPRLLAVGDALVAFFFAAAAPFFDGPAGRTSLGYEVCTFDRKCMVNWRQGLRCQVMVSPRAFGGGPCRTMPWAASCFAWAC